jgi:hypothetical protein
MDHALAVDPALSFASFRILDARARATGRNPLPHRSPGDRLGAMRRFEPCPFMGLIQCHRQRASNAAHAIDLLDVPSTYRAIDALPLPLR